MLTDRMKRACHGLKEKSPLEVGETLHRRQLGIDAEIKCAIISRTERARRKERGLFYE